MCKGKPSIYLLETNKIDQNYNKSLRRRKVLFLILIRGSSLLEHDQIDAKSHQVYNYLFLHHNNLISHNRCNNSSQSFHHLGFHDNHTILRSIHIKHCHHVYHKIPLLKRNSQGCTLLREKWSKKSLRTY